MLRNDFEDRVKLFGKFHNVFGSTMADYRILVARAGQIVALLVAVITLAVGAKRCNWSSLTEVTCDKKDISYGSWKEYNRNGRMNGLYWLFYSSLILILVSGALFVLELLRYRFTKLLIYIICGIAALVCLINFCICIYYSSGSAMTWKGADGKDVYITSRSWIAACVFLFLAVGFYCLDMVIALKLKPVRRAVTMNA